MSTNTTTLTQFTTTAAESTEEPASQLTEDDKDVLRTALDDVRSLVDDLVVNLEEPALPFDDKMKARAEKANDVSDDLNELWRTRKEDLDEDAEEIVTEGNSLGLDAKYVGTVFEEYDNAEEWEFVNPRAKGAKKLLKARNGLAKIVASL